MDDDAIETGFRMALETNAELLSRVPIFDGLSKEQLTAVANKGKKTFFAEGAEILTAGVKGDTTFLVLTGLAITEPVEECSLVPEMLEPGSLIGELSMLVESTHTLTVKAKVRVRALGIARADLYEVLEADPAIAHHFSLKLVERLTLLADDLRRMDTRFAAVEFSLDHTIAAVGF